MVDFASFLVTALPDFGSNCGARKDADKEQLQSELDAICPERNAEAVPVRWQFNLSKARQKMAWAYPKIDQESS